MGTPAACWAGAAASVAVEQSVLDLAPGDFVQVLTVEMRWAVGQITDVVETPWHQLRVHRIGVSSSPS